MPFNPDAYLAGKPSGFDPDAYLANKSLPSASEIPNGRTAKPQWATEYPKLYSAAKTARDVVGPAAEMIGSIGGGIIGGAAGTVASPTVVVNPVTGAVAGSALGYGIVKSALDRADELLGMKAPPSSVSEALGQGVENLATGAMYEMGGQVAGKVLSKTAQSLGRKASAIAGFVADIKQYPKQKAAALARSAAGSKLPEVQQALREAPQGLTASEAIAYQIDPMTGNAVVNAPVMQKLLQEVPQRSVEGVNYFSDIARARNSANQNMLAQIAGSPTQAGSIASRGYQKEALNKLTTPMREMSLDAANQNTQLLRGLQNQADILGNAAARKVQDVRRFTEAGDRAQQLARTQLIEKGLPVGASKYTYIGGDLANAAENLAKKSANQSLALGEGARFSQQAANNLEAQGLKPLESQSLIEKISPILNDPKSGVAGNDVLRGSIENFIDDVNKWTNNVGVIDAYALESIRKNSVNSAIAKFRPGLDQTAQKNLASSVLSQIKPAIDDAIETAGGTGWRSYLDTHSAGMRELSKTKLGAEAMKLYSSSPQKFVELVENNSPKTIQKMFGPDTYDIVKAMGDETASRLQEAGKQVQRAKDIQMQATAGEKAFNELMKDHFFEFQLPNTLNVATTSINKVLDILTGRVGKKTMDILTNAAKDAKSFNELLDTVPASDRIKILKTLKDPKAFESISQKVNKVLPKSTRGGIAIGLDSVNRGNGVNALAPSYDNQNALAVE